MVNLLPYLFQRAAFLNVIIVKYIVEKKSNILKNK